MLSSEGGSQRCLGDVPEGLTVCSRDFGVSLLQAALGSMPVRAHTQLGTALMLLLLSTHQAFQLGGPCTSRRLSFRTGVATRGSVRHQSRIYMYERESLGGHLSGHTGGSVMIGPSTATSTSTVPQNSSVNTTTYAASGTKLAPVDSSELQARLMAMESKLRTVEKQLMRVESSVTRSAGKKSVTLNWDLGPDATIESGDIAKGAAAAFGFMGMILGRSLAKNLWLLGGVSSGVLAAYLSREEEGGALSDTVRAVGYEVAMRTRQYLFMWRTGKLSYVYFKRWEELDQKYAIVKKVEALKLLSLEKYGEAKKAEKKYKVGQRLMGFFVASVHVSIDGVQKLLNAKDREEMILKLPRPLRNLLTTKEQRKQARLKKYRVKFCGMREWRPFDDE